VGILLHGIFGLFTAGKIQNRLRAGRRTYDTQKRRSNSMLYFDTLNSMHQHTLASHFDVYKSHNSFISNTEIQVLH
jgi:hypothetical protein